MGEYDVIVAGGGVAGVAAAVSAARMGKKVLLTEKTISLGGLATIGLVNLFVPMCNGRGTKIIKGMAQEFFDLAVKYGFDSIPEDTLSNGEKADTNDFEIAEIPAATYAVFKVKGKMPDAFRETYKRICGEFLVQSRYDYAGIAELEVYPSDDIANPNYECEIWVG